MIHRNVKIFIAVAVILVVSLIFIANKAASTKLSDIGQDISFIEKALAMNTPAKALTREAEAAVSPDENEKGSMFKRADPAKSEMRDGLKE